MRTLFLLAALVVATSAHGEQVRLDVPIMIESEIGKDACPTRGRITGVADQPDGALPVRTGPGEGAPFKEIDRLHETDLVLVCERLAGWSGIIYGSDPLECRTFTVLPTRQEYTGPCQRGWVPSRFVSVGSE